MHIDGWHIDGFGVFNGYTQRGLGPGLTVFVGPNEAGKSTLLAFLRGILVGYPSRNASAYYPPLNGGTHGGRVFLRGPEGEITVERMVSRRTPHVLFPDHAEDGEEAVRRLLGGVDEGLFKSVFAFSLSELQDLKSLTGEGVRDRIFSAGIAGAGRSAREVMARLDKEADGLLRPRKGGAINELIERLRAAEAAASEARAAAAGYEDLRAAEAHAELRVVATGEREESLRVRLADLRVLLDLWESRYVLDQAEERLAGLGPVEDLPPGSEQRLSRALTRVDATRMRAAEIQADRVKGVRDLEITLASLEPDIAALSAQIEDVSGRTAVFRDRRESLAESGATLHRAEEHLERALSDLGPGWDEARVRDCDLSLARVEEVRGWKELLEASARTVQEADRGLGASADRLRDVSESRDRIAARLDALDAPDEAGLKIEAAVLSRLKTGVREMQAGEARVAALRAALSERERALVMFRAAGAVAGPAPAGGGRSTAWMLGIAAAGLAMVAAILGAASDRAWGVALGAGALILMLAAVGTSLAARSRAPVRGSGPDVAGLEASVEDEKAVLGNEEAALAEIRAAVVADAASLGLAGLPGWHEIEERESILWESRESARTYAEMRARLQEVEDDLVRAQTESGRKQDTAQRARDESARVSAEWTAWKSDLGVPTGLDGDGASEFLRAVRAARGRLEARDEAAEHHRDLLATCAAWEDSARALLTAAGVRGDSLAGEALARSVDGLHERCEADRRVRERSSLLQEQVRQLEARLAVARDEITEAEAERDGVLREAGVTDEAAFQAQVALLNERRAIEAAATEARQVIDIRLGKGSLADALRKELAGGLVDEWRREEERVARDLEEASGESREAIRSHRDSERARQLLESSSDVAARELDVTGVREELRSALRRWQVVKAARLLIEDTLAEYSRTRQPPVLREASDGFSQVTAGAYTQIIERDDAEGFVVVDDRGGVKRPEELSRGTLEQLYLSLRFGLAREFGRRATAVPVIMDDVLVNFDPARARATAEVLSSFAQEHQVLFFTCHPTTAELLRDVDPSVSVVALGGRESVQGTLWTG